MFYAILDFVQLGQKLVKLSHASGSCMEQECISRKLYRLIIFVVLNRHFPAREKQNPVEVRWMVDFKLVLD
jgi:hypothetical protein